MDRISKRKFYKAVIEVVILCEDCPYEQNSLGGVAYDISIGECSGSWTIKKQTVLDGKQAARELQKQGSAPGFFQLTEKGEDIDG